jgi:hypothetical protein
MICSTLIILIIYFVNRKTAQKKTVTDASYNNLFKEKDHLLRFLFSKNTDLI